MSLYVSPVRDAMTCDSPAALSSDIPPKPLSKARFASAPCNRSNYQTHPWNKERLHIPP